jgi:hypothetical protein
VYPILIAGIDRLEALPYLSIQRHGREVHVVAGARDDNVVAVLFHKFASIDCLVRCVIRRATPQPIWFYRLVLFRQKGETSFSMSLMASGIHSKKKFMQPKTKHSTKKVLMSFSIRQTARLKCTFDFGSATKRSNKPKHERFEFVLDQKLYIRI